MVEVGNTFCDLEWCFGGGVFDGEKFYGAESKGDVECSSCGVGFEF